MVFFNCLVLAVFLTVLCKISITKNVSVSSDKSNNNSKDGGTKLKFIKLLNSIANVNKQRLEALDKYMYLDKYYSGKGILRYSDKKDPMVAVLFLNKTDPTTIKLYEIYDSDHKNAPGDTPARNILQHIKEYYDELLKKNNEDEDIFEKQYDSNFHIERNRKKTSNGEKMIPIQNNVEDQDISYAEASGAEEIVPPIQSNIKAREKTSNGKNIILIKNYIQDTGINDAEASDGEEIISPIKNKIQDRDKKEPSDGKNIIPIKNYIQDREINDAETSDGEEIDSKRGRNITHKEINISNEETKISGIDKLKLTKEDSSPDKNKKQTLRLFKSCNKKAAKACKKACKAAGKHVCERYKCSKSMKRSFRKNCARKCKSEFSD